MLGLLPYSFFFFLKLGYLFFLIYLFMAVLDLRFCVKAFSSCGKRGPLFIAVPGRLTIVASLVVEHRLQTRRLSNCGSRAQLLRGIWDLPRPGLEPVSPALAGRFPTTAPPGKPCPTLKMHVSKLTCCLNFYSQDSVLVSLWPFCLNGGPQAQGLKEVMDRASRQ